MIGGTLGARGRARQGFRQIGLRGGVGITVAITAVNPFAATATPPSGQQFVAGSVTIRLLPKDGSFGAPQDIAATITTAGLVSETVTGSFEAAIQPAGYITGDDLLAVVIGATLENYVAPAGVVIDLASVAVAGQASGTASTIIEYLGVPCAAGSQDLLAFVADRGIGGTNAFTIEGVAATELMSAVTVNSQDRIRARKVAHPGAITDADVVVTGLVGASSRGGICVLLSARNAGAVVPSVTGHANGTITYATTIAVEAGDFVLMVMRGTLVDYGAITFTGVDQLAGSTKLAGADHWGAAAIKQISADNPAYPIGWEAAVGPNNQSTSIFIIKPAA